MTIFRKRDGDAGELIQRSLRDELTADEAERLAEWRRESLANEQLYRRTVRLLTAMQSAGAPGAAGATRVPPAVQTILTRARSTDSRLRHPASRLQVWVAAAGIALAVVGTATYVARRHAARGTEEPGRPLADGVGYSTGKSEMATVQLSDGSVVRLAPNSRLRFLQRTASREATLDGRAFFTVAKIAGRPFHVHTRLGDATVLGTRFELATDSSELRLLVVSGRVGLEGTSNHLEVHAGESAGVHNGTVAEPTRLPNAETMNEWVGKFLAFESTPVREVAREIEETYGVHIVPKDSVIANRTVSATFTDRDVRYVIDVVCAVVNAQCTNRSGEIDMASQ